MDVGVVPNRKNQATDRFMMPVKLMEYVFLQIPVIAPRLSIIKYYFDETMIKFFDPENIEDLGRCIVDLCKNPEERWQLVRNANVFFKKYNWKDQEKKYLKLLQ
jgi:glycosyltransferase involved in cell wall biosynthesis